MSVVHLSGRVLTPSRRAKNSPFRASFGGGFVEGRSGTPQPAKNQREVGRTVTNKRRVVSTDQIVDTYLELVDELGPAGPPVRAIAAKLFVSPTTLYERAGPIAHIADLATGRVRVAIADRVAALADGDAEPIGTWAAANPNLALLATNPHRPALDRSTAVHLDALAVIGAFLTDGGEIADPQGLADLATCLSGSNIDPAHDHQKSAGDRSHVWSPSAVLDRIDDDVLAASARVVSTAGAEAWTFQSISDHTGQSPSSLHAARSKSQVFHDLCVTVDAKAREVAADLPATDRSALIEAEYFALGCHGVERAMYPDGPALRTDQQVIRRFAIQLAANASKPTPAMVAAGVAAFIEAVGDRGDDA